MILIVVQILDGNNDANTVVSNVFPTPVKASYVRIRPITWNNHISMRFELLGCEGRYKGLLALDGALTNLHVIHIEILS